MTTGIDYCGDTMMANKMIRSRRISFSFSPYYFFVKNNTNDNNNKMIESLRASVHESWCIVFVLCWMVRDDCIGCWRFFNLKCSLYSFQYYGTCVSSIDTVTTASTSIILSCCCYYGAATSIRRRRRSLYLLPFITVLMSTRPLWCNSYWSDKN